MFVLGIDPGLTRTGYAIVSDGRARPELRSVGVIKTDPGQPLERRLLELQNDIASVIADHQPYVLAIESVFVNKNLQTAISVARASGVVIVAAAQSGMPVHEYTPSAVKSAVAGYGSATKEQVQQMVMRRLNLPAAPKPADASDAVAVALCHLQTARFGGLVAKPVPSA